MTDKQPRLRLPIRMPKPGPTYFARRHNEEQAKKPLDPTGFQLVKFVSVKGELKMLQLYCAVCDCPGCEKAVSINLKNFDLYRTTKAEVTRVKIAVFKILQDKAQKALDAF